MIVVGCPIRDRAWAIDRWFQHTAGAIANSGSTPDVVYLFVCDPNDPTRPHLEQWGAVLDVRTVFVHEEPLEAVIKGRGWNRRDRLEHMVDVRNRLLEHVRAIGPELFWSLDSDIFADALTLASAISTLADGYDAVGSLTWMTSVGYEWPNAGQWANGFRRFPIEPGARYKTDIIAAAKLMTPAAYAVDYELDAVGSDAGEDAGWSLACGRRGLRLAIDGRHPCKHVMGADMLDRVDPRLGW